MDQIVREQCWLNETLLGCNWVSETLKPNEEGLPDDVPASEEGLQAVLTGLYYILSFWDLQLIPDFSQGLSHLAKSQ